MESRKSICIIGGGVGGISLEEGGTWYYTKDGETGRGRVYQSLITNVSKEAACFSDFPYPKDFPPYFTHAKVLEYLKSYVDQFGLDKYIYCDRTVNHIEATRLNGQHKWRVTTCSTSTDSIQDKTQYFDGLIVCTGVNSASRMPLVEGMLTKFKGKVMHSSDYNSPNEVKGKRVLVIGLGNSGGDIVVDTSRQAERSIVSSRSGCWIVPRLFERGLPPDIAATNRFGSFLRYFVPLWIRSRIGNNLLNCKINHDVIGLRSKYSALDPHGSFMVNDELPARIMSGNVIVRPDVARFTEKEVIFVDGREEEVDCVICATGYETTFPFINDNILPDRRSQLKLFEWMFPYEYEVPESIAVVGVVPSAGGSDLPILECQTRYIAQVMAGVTKLPSVATMNKNYEFLMSELPDGKDSSQFRTELGITYQDRLAKRGGFYPSFWSIFFRNPILAIKVYFGPFLAYHYRLRGRHPWTGATNRIMKALPNTLYAIINSRGNQYLQ